jgi:Outer membrane protein beta-barrel domain
MKRIWITTATVLLMTVAFKANAQSGGSSGKDGVHLGIRAGVNSSNLIKDGDNNTSTGAKLGLNAAVFLELPITTGFSIQPELQFSQKGYKSTGSFLGAPYEYKQTTNFIEVPLLAKFKPSKNFGILVGPQFSFLASTQTKFTVNNTSFEDEVKQDNDNLRKNVLGGVIGIEAGSGPLVFGLRYNLDFQNNNGDGTSSTPTYRNQVISLSAGFRF